MMMTTARRTSRATPISRVRATCRVPFGLIPVRAAMAVMSTARPSHPSQLMTDDSIHDLQVEPALRCASLEKVARQRRGQTKDCACGHHTGPHSFLAF